MNFLSEYYISKSLVLTNSRLLSQLEGWRLDSNGAERLMLKGPPQHWLRQKLEQ